MPSIEAGGSLQLWRPILSWLNLIAFEAVAVLRLVPGNRESRARTSKVKLHQRHQISYYPSNKSPIEHPPSFVHNHRQDGQERMSIFWEVHFLFRFYFVPVDELIAFVVALELASD